MASPDRGRQTREELGNKPLSIALNVNISKTVGDTPVVTVNDYKEVT